MLAGLAATAFAFQALIILIDEFYFHRKRFLPRWELAGHPVDTVCLLLFFGSLRVFSPTGTYAVAAAVGFGLISCFIITKDEWIHKKHATGTENWLHSLLFIVHPIVTGFFFALWYRNDGQASALTGLAICAVGMHLAYQIFIAVRRWHAIAAE